MSAIQQTVCRKMAVAVEMAAAKWLVGSYVGGTGRVRRKALVEETAEARLEALAAEIGNARRRYGLPETAPVVVAYEAGQEGFWLVRALRERGIAAEVIDPVSLPVDRRARRAKTDRLDVEALAKALWRWWTGDRSALRMVRVPSEAAEDEREWERERDRLKNERRALNDRIVKKLRTQGVWRLPTNWRTRLREGGLRTWSGAELPRMLSAMLQRELTRLEEVEAHLRALQREEQFEVSTQQRMAHLSRLCGIGRVGARSLALRLFWRQFDNRRQVGACVGLVGTPYDSGTQRQDQGISKIGDPKLRALLVELAWLWLRHQPHSTITRWFTQRTQGAGARGKRVMIVAVARRLVIALWRYLAHGVVPDGARLKRLAA